MLRVGSITRDGTDAASPQVIGASGRVMSGLESYPLVSGASHTTSALGIFHPSGLFGLKCVDPLIQASYEFYTILFWLEEGLYKR